MRIIKCAVCGVDVEAKSKNAKYCKSCCIQANKAKNKEYQNSDKYKEYQKSDKRKEYQKEYQKSDKRKEYQKEYRKKNKTSDKYKEYRNKYKTSASYIKSTFKLYHPDLIELKRLQLMIFRECKAAK
jgi:ribosomal protein S4